MSGIPPIMGMVAPVLMDDAPPSPPVPPSEVTLADADPVDPFVAVPVTRGKTLLISAFIGAFTGLLVSGGILLFLYFVAHR